MKLRALATLLLALPLLTAPSPAVAADPDLEVAVAVSGLQNPWAMTFLPDGAMLFTERDEKTVSLRLPNGEVRVVLDSPPGMWSGGETGLMGIETAADFAESRIFYTCHGYRSGTTKDVRVVAWRLDAARTSATLVKTLVTGLASTSGRHGGCALERGTAGELFIGTGDAATGALPQRRTSGGGKVLRVSAATGLGWPGNPFLGGDSVMAGRIYTYGHRNVQGLARQPGTNRIWSAEHGSYRDDEVNALVRGGNYGWNPVPRRAGDPAYNEGANSPMTDHTLPGTQRSASWTSGTPTLASSGASFVSGDQWGSLDGALAVAMLKASQLRFLRFDSSQRIVRPSSPPVLDGTYGRLRGVQLGPDGALWVSTSNGSNDRILRITPAAPR